MGNLYYRKRADFIDSPTHRRSLTWKGKSIFINDQSDFNIIVPDTLNITIPGPSVLIASAHFRDYHHSNWLRQ